MGKAGVTIGAFVAMWVLFLAAPVMAAPVCSPEQVDLRGDFGTARFSVAVADDPRERAQGLMHVERMARSTGMIFLYPAPQTAAFWMKNTLIPLDMIFVGADGVVRKVHENAIPHAGDRGGGRNAAPGLWRRGRMGLSRGRNPKLARKLNGTRSKDAFQPRPQRVEIAPVGAWRSLVARRFWVP